MHFISASCHGEQCGICWREGHRHIEATHKVGEEIAHDDPNQMRHNLTQYVCCRHYTLIMGQATPCEKTHGQATA